MTTITVEDHLRSFRSQHGEEAWRAEVQRLVIAALRTGSEKQEAFWRSVTKDFDWLDWDGLAQQAKTTAAPPSTERLIAETIKSQMPGIRSQAQYDAVIGAMEAVRLVVNALLERDEQQEQQSRAVLELAFDAVRKATDASLKLNEVPEAVSDASAQPFKEAPAQFHEVDVQAELLQELACVKTFDALNRWYEGSRERRDKIVSQSLRNELLDRVRAKRNTF